MEYAEETRLGEPQVCILNSVIYRPGTQIPVSSRFGPDAVVYNHSSGAIVPKDAHGIIRLETNGVYTIEDLESPVLRLSRAPESSQTPRTQDAFLPLDKNFLKSFALGRGSNRRRSDPALSIHPQHRSKHGAKGSILPHKVSSEIREEMAGSGHRRASSSSKAQSPSTHAPANESDTTENEALHTLQSIANPVSGFFTLRRKMRRSMVEPESSASAYELNKTPASGSVHLSMSNLAGGRLNTITTIAASNEEIDLGGDDVDILDFLKGPPMKYAETSNTVSTSERAGLPETKHNRTASNIVIPSIISASNEELHSSSRPSSEGQRPQQQSSAQTSHMPKSNGSSSAALPQQTNHARSSSHSMLNSVTGNQAQINASASPTHANARPKQTVTAHITTEMIMSALGIDDQHTPTPTTSGSDVPPMVTSQTDSPLENTTPNSISPAARGSYKPTQTSYMIDVESPSYDGYLRSNLFPEANMYFKLSDYSFRVYKISEQNSASANPAQEIDLVGCVAIPVRQSTENAFDIFHSGGKIRCYATTYHAMVTWVGIINTASSNITAEHGPAKVTIEDLHYEIYRKEYNTLLANLREDSGITDTAAIACSADPVLEEMPHSPLRQGSIDDMGSPLIQYQTGSDGFQTPFHVTQATMDKLVERLTGIHGPDKLFITMLLHTYRHFTSASKFIKSLTARLHSSYGETSPNSDGSPVSAGKPVLLSDSWRPIIKIRTIAVVQMWIKLIWAPDFVDLESRENLDKFVSAIQGSFGSMSEDKALDAEHVEEFKILCGHMREIVKRRESRYLASAASIQERQQATTATEKTKQEFLFFDPIELAKHLTLREHEIFCTIRPIHFLLRLWYDEKDPIIAREIQPINDLVETFNTVSYWVATEVCTQPEIKNRVKVIENFVRLAREFRRLNNYHTLMAIVSGLNLVAVSRLKNTWEAVEQKRVKQLNELESLLSPVNNFRTYRILIDEHEEETAKTHKPYIPILSLFLKDLLFLNDGNPKMTENGQINVDKLRTIYTRVQQILMPQQTLYAASQSQHVSQLQAYCTSLRALKEKALYKYSCLCEPKSGDDVLRLREKWMSQS